VADNYPSTAHILTLIGGILVIIEALVDVVFAGAIGSLVPAFGGVLAAIIIIEAVIGLIVGIVILYGSVQLRSNPGGSKTWGIFIIVLAIVSLFTASGFFIGFLLVLIGGILAYTWKPPMAATTGWNASPAMGGWGATTGAPPAGTPIQPGAVPAGAQKFCAHCGSANAPTATFCAHCGAALT
jgi:hypothetical protein